jgi:hypothetical protein
MQHRSLRSTHSSGSSRNGDHQPHADGQTHRNEQRMTSTALQLANKVDEEEAMVASASPGERQRIIPPVLLSLADRSMRSRRCIESCPLAVHDPAPLDTGPDDTHPAGASDRHGPSTAAWNAGEAGLTPLSGPSRFPSRSGWEPSAPHALTCTRQRPG